MMFLVSSEVSIIMWVWSHSLHKMIVFAFLRKLGLVHRFDHADPEAETLAPNLITKTVKAIDLKC